MMPIWHLPDPEIVALNIVVWGAWSALCGLWAHRLPLGRFERNSWWSRPRAVERDGRLYERLGVRRWKDRLPEAGALFAAGFSKRTVSHRDRAYLERFTAETRRAELAHWTGMGIAPVFVLWNPLWAEAVMVAYAFGANVPCIAVQRYNRARLVRILNRRAALPA